MCCISVVYIVFGETECPASIGIWYTIWLTVYVEVALIGRFHAFLYSLL